MKKLLYKLDYKIDNCHIGYGYGPLTINGRVYSRQIRFLWWKKTFYTYTMNVPYIKDPYYDTEYSTNRILHSYAPIVKQILIDKIDELKNKENVLSINDMKTLIILCYSTSEVHIFKIDKTIEEVNEDFISELGFNPSECSWMVSNQINIINHKGVILK